MKTGSKEEDRLRVERRVDGLQETRRKEGRARGKEGGMNGGREAWTTVAAVEGGQVGGAWRRERTSWWNEQQQEKEVGSKNFTPDPLA